MGNGNEACKEVVCLFVCFVASVHEKEGKGC